MEVSIRPLRIGDSEAVQRYASDKLVARTTNIPHPYPKDGGESFVKNAVQGWENRKHFKFAIISDNKMVGGIDLNKPDFERRTIQCDYAISSSHWGRGIVTKAIGLAVSYAFRELDMNIVNSACLERNPASSRVLEKNGFIKTRKFIYNNDKFKNEPAHFFRLTREEWTKRNSEPAVSR
jgi:RimJ/RimL family protein N-acetyltransferase